MKIILDKLKYNSIFVNINLLNKLMNSDEIIKVIDKLVGGIEPQGETNIDNERFENLKTLTEVLEHYHQKVYDVSYYKKRQEYSVKRAGEFADKFITDSVEWFDMIRK